MARFFWFGDGLHVCSVCANKLNTAKAITITPTGVAVPSQCLMPAAESLETNLLRLPCQWLLICCLHFQVFLVADQTLCLRRSFGLDKFLQRLNQNLLWKTQVFAAAADQGFAGRVDICDPSKYNVNHSDVGVVQIVVLIVSSQNDVWVVSVFYDLLICFFGNTRLVFNLFSFSTTRTSSYCRISCPEWFSFCGVNGPCCCLCHNFVLLCLVVRGWIFLILCIRYRSRRCAVGIGSLVFVFSQFEVKVFFCSVF